MTRREKHNIESNCVSFDDDCFAETNSHGHDTGNVEQQQTETVEMGHKTGEDFVKHLAAKIINSR